MCTDMSRIDTPRMKQQSPCTPPMTEVERPKMISPEGHIGQESTTGMPKDGMPEGKTTTVREEEISSALGRTSAVTEFRDKVHAQTNIHGAVLQLLSLVECLQSRVMQLEKENAMLRSIARQHQDGEETMFRILQTDIADLQRQMYSMKIAKRTAEENESASIQRAEILAMQLEHSIQLLDSMRTD